MLSASLLILLISQTMANPPLLSISTNVVNTTYWMQPSFGSNYYHIYAWRSKNVLLFVKGKRLDKGNIPRTQVVQIDLKSQRERLLLEGSQGIAQQYCHGIELSHDGHWALIKRNIEFLVQSGNGAVVSLDPPYAVKTYTYPAVPMGPDVGSAGQVLGVWQRDNRHWTTVIGSSGLPIAYIYDRTTMNPPLSLKWTSFPWKMDKCKPAVVGVTSRGSVIVTNSIWKDDEILLYKLDLSRGSSTNQEVKCVRKYRILPPQGAYAEEFVMSPQGDRIAWMFHFDSIKKTPQGQKKGERAELWVSHLDGKGMHPIGFLNVYIANKHADDITAADFPMQVGWLPDGHKLSFIYKDALWTVPAN